MALSPRLVSAVPAPAPYEGVLLTLRESPDEASGETRIFIQDAPDDSSPRYTDIVLTGPFLTYFLNTGLASGSGRNSPYIAGTDLTDLIDDILADAVSSPFAFITSHDYPGSNWQGVTGLVESGIRIDNGAPDYPGPFLREVVIKVGSQRMIVEWGYGEPRIPQLTVQVPELRYQALDVGTNEELRRAFTVKNTFFSAGPASDDIYVLGRSTSPLRYAFYIYANGSYTRFDLPTTTTVGAGMAFSPVRGQLALVSANDLLYLRNAENTAWGAPQALPSGVTNPVSITFTIEGDLLLLNNSSNASLQRLYRRRLGESSWENDIDLPNDPTYTGTISNFRTGMVGVAADPDGCIYVANFRTDKIYKNTNGIWDGGEIPTPPNNPTISGLSVDRDGNILLLGSIGSSTFFFTYDIEAGTWDSGTPDPDNFGNAAGIAANISPGATDAQKVLFEDAATGAKITKLELEYTTLTNIRLTATLESGFSMAGHQLYLISQAGEYVALTAGAGPWNFEDDDDDWEFFTGIEALDKVMMVVADSGTVSDLGSWTDVATAQTQNVAEIPALVNGAWYIAQIRLKDSAGTSDWVSGFAKPRVPIAPGGVEPVLINRYAGALIHVDDPVPVTPPADDMGEGINIEDGVPTNVLIQYRETDSGQWQDIVTDFEGRDIDVDLPNEKRAEVRVRTSNDGGTGVGMPAVIPKVGMSKTGAPLPATAVNPATGRSWYDDDPGLPGYLWVIVGTRIGNSGGEEYVFDFPSRVGEAVGVDIVGVEEWAFRGWEVGEECVVTRDVPIGGAIVEAWDLYRCIQSHEANSLAAHPSVANNLWDLRVRGPVSKSVSETPLAPPTPEAGNNPPISATKTLNFDMMVGPGGGHSESNGGVPGNKPDGKGEYKIGFKRPWKQINDWENLTGRSNTITLSLRSLAAAMGEQDWVAFCQSIEGAIKPGKLAGKWPGDGRWIVWNIEYAHVSLNGNRCTFSGSIDAVGDPTDTSDIAYDTPVAVAFSFTFGDVTETPAA